MGRKEWRRKVEKNRRECKAKKKGKERNGVRKRKVNNERKERQKGAKKEDKLIVRNVIIVKYKMQNNNIK